MAVIFIARRSSLSIATPYQTHHLANTKFQVGSAAGSSRANAQSIGGLRKIVNSPIRLPSDGARPEDAQTRLPPARRKAGNDRNPADDPQTVPR
jgi:hypothetical protein